MAKRGAVFGANKGATGSVIRVSVSFDSADFAEVKAIAEEKRVSASWVIRDAVISYLNARAPLFARERSRAQQ